VALDSTSADAHFILGMTYSLQHRHEEAIQELRTAYRLSGGRPVIYARLGVAYAEAGRKKQAEAVFRDVEEMYHSGRVSVYYLAMVYLGRHEYEKAIDAFEQAYEQHEGLLVYMNVEPITDAVRNNPRFRELARKIGFDAE
jgi:cytochrome c-type biogenesis protein CcmH/NrfG